MPDSHGEPGEGPETADRVGLHRAEQSPEARYFRAIGSVATALSSALSTEDLLRLTLAEAISATAANAGTIYLPAGEGRFKLAVHQGLSEGTARDHEIIAPGSRTLDAIAAGKGPVSFTQRLEDRRGPISDESRAMGTQTWASVAIVTLDTVVGILGVSSRSYNAFDEGHLQALTVIGQLLGLSLANSVAHERAYREIDTERQHKRAEMDAILGSMADGVLICDRNGTITRVNEAAARIMGASPADIEGRSMLFAHPSGQGEDSVRRVLSGEAESIHYIVQMQAEPQPRVLSATASAIRRHAALEGAVIVLRDITGAHTTERKKEEFLRHLSHEMRGPLAVISAASQMMRKNLARRGLAKEARHATLVNEHALRLSGMVEELIESSRLESGVQALTLEPADAGELVRAVLRRFRYEQDQAEDNHSITAVIQPSLSPLMLDRRRIDQVLTNLISNAIKYSPDGGEIKIAVRVEQGAPERLRITVTDSGIGVPGEDKDRVFEQTFRGAAARAISPSGLGLGLYISKLAVEAHGGQIGVEDAPGGGAVFWFTLPTRED